MSSIVIRCFGIFQFFTMSLAFKRRLLRVAFTFLKMQSGKILKWVRKFCTNRNKWRIKENRRILLRCKSLDFWKIETVGHIYREVSRCLLFCWRRERARRWFCAVITLPSLARPYWWTRNIVNVDF